MLSLIVVLALTSPLVSAMVCLPEMCENVKQPLLSCQGGVIKNGGFCGCTDVCAKVEGETCQAEYMLGVIPQGVCDSGLHCQKQENMALGAGKCVKSPPDADLMPTHPAKRQLAAGKTRCEQMRLSSMISMVVYEGQWFAKCDADGNFLPQQCDNTNHCFCVNTLTGVVLEGTKVLGAADCSGVKSQ